MGTKYLYNGKEIIFNQDRHYVYYDICTILYDWESTFNNISTSVITLITEKQLFWSSPRITLSVVGGRQSLLFTISFLKCYPSQYAIHFMIWISHTLRTILPRVFPQTKRPKLCNWGKKPKTFLVREKLSRSMILNYPGLTESLSNMANIIQNIFSQKNICMLQYQVVYIGRNCNFHRIVCTKLSTVHTCVPCHSKMLSNFYLNTLSLPRTGPNFKKALWFWELGTKQKRTR